MLELFSSAGTSFAGAEYAGEAASKIPAPNLSAPQTPTTFGLAHVTEHDGRAVAAAMTFDSFWRAVDYPRPQDRWESVNAALNGIYLAIGRKRDTDVVSRYESAARKRWMEEGRDDARD